METSLWIGGEYEQISIFHKPTKASSICTTMSQGFINVNGTFSLRNGLTNLFSATKVAGGVESKFWVFKTYIIIIQWTNLEVGNCVYSVWNRVTQQFVGTENQELPNKTNFELCDITQLSDNFTEDDLNKQTRSYFILSGNTFLQILLITEPSTTQWFKGGYTRGVGTNQYFTYPVGISALEIWNNGVIFYSSGDESKEGSFFIPVSNSKPTGLGRTLYFGIVSQLAGSSRTLFAVQSRNVALPRDATVYALRVFGDAIITHTSLGMYQVVSDDISDFTQSEYTLRKIAQYLGSPGIPQTISGTTIVIPSEKRPRTKDISDALFAGATYPKDRLGNRLSKPFDHAPISQVGWNEENAVLVRLPNQIKCITLWSDGDSLNTAITTYFDLALTAFSKLEGVAISNRYEPFLMLSKNDKLHIMYEGQGTTDQVVNEFVTHNIHACSFPDLSRAYSASMIFASKNPFLLRSTNYSKTGRGVDSSAVTPNLYKKLQSSQQNITGQNEYFNKAFADFNATFSHSNPDRVNLFGLKIF